MGIVKSLKRGPRESLSDYARRLKYGILRRIVPSVRERYRLELMSGPIGYWDQNQKYQSDFLTRMGLKPHHTLLCIGCGPLSSGLAFIPYLKPYNYVGIDIRKEAISEAHLQVAKAGLAEKNPFLVVSSTFGRDELGDRKFDYIWASQVLYHIDDEKLKAFFKQVSVRMKPNSKFYGDIIGYPNKVCADSHWHEFSFFLHSVESLKDLGARYGLEMSNLGRIQDYGYPEEVALKTNIMLEFRKKSKGNNLAIRKTNQQKRR